jgi:hypothetical protein
MNCEGGENIEKLRTSRKMVASIAVAGAIVGVGMLMLATQARGAMGPSQVSGTMTFAPNQGFAWTARAIDEGVWDRYELTGRLYDYSPLVWSTTGQVHVQGTPWIGVQLANAPPTRTGSDFGWIADQNGPLPTRRIITASLTGKVLGLGDTNDWQFRWIYVK